MSHDYSVEDHGEQGRVRHGSQTFYDLLQEMAETHDKKSHDYADTIDPAGNYHFAGEMASMFSHSPQDAGFVGRLAEKIYRIKNLESSGKLGITESLEDTERDIATITALWISDRRDRRRKTRNALGQLNQRMKQGMAEIEKKSAILEQVVHNVQKLNSLELHQLSDYMRRLGSDKAIEEEKAKPTGLNPTQSPRNRQETRDTDRESSPIRDKS